MPIQVALNHRTTYRYDRHVWLSPHVIRLRPAPHCRTPVLSYSLKVAPREHFVNWVQDPYSNRFARLVFPKRTRELTVEVDLVAELTTINPFDFFVEDYAQRYPFEYDSELRHELAPYLAPAPLGPRLAQRVEASRRDGMGTVDFLVEVNRRLWSDVRYLIRMEPGVQTPEQMLEAGSGSCRDSAWLLAQLLRRLGLAARFVSGYLVQLAPDVRCLDGPSGPERDFTDLHAWTEVYVPGAGWIGLDPTSGLLAGEGHLPLACTADPRQAAPIAGQFSPDNEAIVHAEPDDTLGRPRDQFEVVMSVTRIREAPRVTRPYTEEQWRQIDALGRRIDADLVEQDVRLTMGGEPTFVSVDDFEGGEWNTEALGESKRHLADLLVRRLMLRFAPGALLHHGQGKWYPGESLPRWAFTLWWRRDGEPVWHDPALIADPRQRRDVNTNHARQFIHALADRLGVPSRFALPGYEDAWHYLWKERRLPVNVDPLQSRLDNAEDRARLARVFEQGLDHVVGFALPLRPDPAAEGGWASGAWFFRPERMYLIPGDSPMGYRLPLDSLPWALPADGQEHLPLDPMAPRPPLPRGASWAQRRLPAQRADARRGIAEQQAQDRVPGAHESASWVVRTALCVEARGGALHVFMPPMRHLEDYLALVHAVEQTAAELRMPVLVEGYAPPDDPRVNHLKISPDPGVIEVNLHPAATWDELVANTNGLYDEARHCRLGTEKFLLDGRHTGTGGGNHIVLGGPTPADSPLLRRPDLLGSLVRLWHNHPSLSYLFSTLFVGPTSQSPRVDEGRRDAVYELEIALRQIPRDRPPSPWLVDRIFRNVLIDVTGNTHRAEFCVDKLYSPDGPTGRLGLLELRAFEMPPHARMSLAQHLLLRAIVAWTWRQPCERPLVRWGTEIHDRFMLPHFVREDLDDLLEHLRRAGYDLRPDWFDAHFEFRFPRYGSIARRGIELELRQAIEPWHVMGEEAAAGGTARFVDSSVERLQVLVSGMVDPRHVVLCNGRRVPLHPTGVNGQFVAGVRFRAWRPPSCLHPTIGVHSPLTFDLVDTWSGRSIGGCMYHVAHPGGRAYDRFPVNALEAESRRVARFASGGHSPGAIAVPPRTLSPEYPFTLDLRTADA